jgi:colicin import membrane protein
MIRRYSNTAPQSGTQADAERFLAALGTLEAATKAVQNNQNKAIAELMTSVKSMHGVLTALLAKAEDPTVKAEDAMDDAEDEVMSKARAESAALIDQAKALLVKADRLIKAAEEHKDDGEAEEAAKAKAKARANKKAAALLLGKARIKAYVGGSVELRKAIVSICAKADVEAADEEDIDKAEEEETAKAAAAAAAAQAAPLAAKAEEPAMQADRQDPENGNQAATAKALNDALAGIQVLTTTVHGLMDRVNNSSRGAFVKAAPVVPPVVPVDIYTRIERALDNGNLSNEQAITAEGIAQGFDAVAKGRLDKSVVEARLAKAPAAVQQLYAEAA